MNSDEERLEEMLKAVMETESAIAAEEGDISEIPDLMDELTAEELAGVAFPGQTDSAYHEMSGQSTVQQPDASIEEQAAGTPDLVSGKAAEPAGDAVSASAPDDTSISDGTSAKAADSTPEETSESIPDLQADAVSEKPSDLSPEEVPEGLSGSSGEELPESMSDLPVEELPERASDSALDEIPERTSDSVLDEIPEKASGSALDEIPERSEDELTDSLLDEIPEKPAKEPHKPTEEELGINPLELLAMSEDEVDQVLEKEAGLGEMFSGRREVEVPERAEPEEISNVEDDLSDIESLLQMADNHEQIEENAPKMGRKLPDIPDEPEEDSAEPAKKSGKKKKEKKKDRKKDKKEADNGEQKQGFGKKIAAALFGSDDEEELDDEDQNAVGEKGEGAAEEKKAAGAKDKKKKEKKQPKKSGPDPKKAEKEKQKKAKNAEKAKKRAEKAQKAEQAAKEKRAEKKLPKKKVFVWVLLCASIGIGILLLNTIGMNTLQLTEARDSFANKDFETAYQLLNGKELSEEDQLLFVQASAILHIQHAEEVYEIHLKLEKMARALDDLLRGVDKYQELLQSGRENVITPEATEHYQNILRLLQENYGLSEAGAMEINALEGDYEYSLQIEAIVNGETYQSQTELEAEQEEEAAKYPELEDMLPEEEEFFNDSSD